MTHRAHKVAAGEYIYRNHCICKEETNGPEGGLRRYWSISGDLDGPDANYAHAELPQVETLAAAKLWLDAHLEGKAAQQHQIERNNAPKVWGD